MNQKLLDRLILLTDEAMAALAGGGSLSSAIQKAIRIARLRSDWENLLWLELEVASFDAQEIEDLKLRLVEELGPHFLHEDLKALWARHLNGYMNERSTQPSKGGKGVIEEKRAFIGQSVPNLEKGVQSIDRAGDHLALPSGMHPVDLYFENEKMRDIKLSLVPKRTELTTILNRIAGRVNAFLSTTEKQLFVGQISSEIFERNRQVVDKRLLEVAPEVASQFASAYKRLESDEGPEALSQALTSCRRALKTLADTLYPACDTPILGSDGKMHVLNDAMFINRLWQYIHEKLSSGAGAKSTVASLVDLGNRLDKLNDLSSKGVHASISRDDADQCVIQTYLVIGDILRLDALP